MGSHLSDFKPSEMMHMQETPEKQILLHKIHTYTVFIQMFCIGIPTEHRTINQQVD